MTQQVVQRRSAATPGWVDVAPLAYNASSWADTGLTTNQWYEYRVRTVGPGGSTYSGVSARIWTTPAAPTGVSAAKQGDDIVVRWSSSAPERSSQTVHVIGEGATVIATVPWDQLSYTVPAPNPLLPHTYWVATRTAGLESGRVNANTIQLAAAPLKPTNLQPSTYAAFQSAPELKIAGTDGELHTVTGRGLFDSNASNAWTLSNGLTEISASGPHLTVRNRFIDGSGWDTTRSYEFRFTVVADVINPFTRRTVVRNTDHTVTARFTGGGGGGLARHSLDLTLKRGARQVECVWRTDYGELMWVGRATVDTATDLTVAGVDVGVVEASGTSAT